MKPEPFYMVVNVGDQSYPLPGKLPHGSAPTYCHVSLPEAEKECLRLAARYGGPFVILKAVAYTSWRETDQLSRGLMDGLQEWARRMGLTHKVMVHCMEPLDDPEVPF